MGNLRISAERSSPTKSVARAVRVFYSKAFADAPIRRGDLKTRHSFFCARELVVKPQAQGEGIMEEENKKNYAKRDSYALASEMLQDAILHNYPLQAIAIEESIISDRLWSALKSVNIANGRHETMGAALKEWERIKKDNSVDNPFDAEIETLYDRLCNWWDCRNKLIHGIVKSSVGLGPKTTAEKFLQSANAAAKKGEELVRLVKNWSKKKVYKAKKDKGLKQ